MRERVFQTLLLISMLLATSLLIPRAISQLEQYGPILEHKRLVTYLSPDSRLLAMQRGDAHIWGGLSRPYDIEMLGGDWFTIYGTPGFHISYITFNMRKWYFGPQDGGAPGQALRHAIAHLVPKDQIIGYYKKYTADVSNTVVPPALKGWCSFNVDPHPFNRTTLTMGEGIQALHIHSGGTPFAGGSDPGVVYQFNGTSWEAVSPDLGKAVLSLVEFGGELYAGTKSYANVGQVWKYDGVTWVLVGDGMDKQASSLAVWNGKLYAGTVPGARLLRYNVATNDWTQVLSGVLPNGIRSMYVWEADNALYLGDFNSDKIARYDGVICQRVLDRGRSCIWDIRSYGGDLYASAWLGVLYKSSDGFSWSKVWENAEARNIWALEVFEDYLYMGMDWCGSGERVAQLWRYNVTSPPELVWTTPVVHYAEGIISMATNSSALFLGLGGEEGYYSSSGEGNVFITPLPGPPPPPSGPIRDAGEILLEAGWYWDGGSWRAPDGTVLPTIEFLSPTYEVDPDKFWMAYEIAGMMQEIALPDGTSAPLPVVHQPMNSPILYEQVFHLHDYDMAILDLNTENHPDYLYEYFHSSQDFPWGPNSAGLTNPALDAELETLMCSLNHTERIDACHNVQLQLMGDPAYTYENTTDGLLPWVPIYSQARYDAFNPDLLGMVISYGSGAAFNWWTEQYMYWSDPTGHESDLVPGGVMANWILNDNVSSLNPLFPQNPYGWQILQEIYDPTVMRNPFTHESIPWVLDETKDPDYPDTPGYYVETEGPDVPPGGMKVTYWLIDDTPLWHDGHQVDAFDVEFAWEYQTEYQIGQWWETFMYFDHADVIDVPTNRTVAAYFTETSQFTPLVLAEMALMFPEHIWGCTHERGGRATPSCVYVGQYAEMYDGTPVTVESGLCGCAVGPPQVAPLKTTCIHGSGCVLDDPFTPENEILMYDPTEYSWPTPAYPWLTELIGTGCWVLKDYNPVALVADLLAFDTRTHDTVMPGCHYWKTTDEIHDHLVEMFHEIGDVDRDGVIYDIDFVRVLDAYGSSIGDPFYDPDADLNEDGIINCVELCLLERYFGCQFPPGGGGYLWFDPALVSVTPSKIVVGSGYNVSIKVRVENQGFDSVAVDVSLYYNGDLIGTQGPINLGLGGSTLTFLWNTTEIPKGNYTITATTPVFPCEPNTADNSLTGGWVVVTIPGDVDGDYYVGSADAGVLATAYGTKQGDPLYVPEADFDGDGYIGSADAGILATAYGTTYP